MERKIEKIIETKVRFLNVVIYPENRQSAQRYCELLAKIKDDKVAVNTYSEKITQIESLDIIDNIYCGQLVNFTDLRGKKWFDKDKNVVVDFYFDLNKFPNAKEIDFYFFPKYHKIAVIGDKGPSLKQVQTFFQQAFNKVVMQEFNESVEVNIVTDSVAIDKIFENRKLTSLEIHVSYSNNDMNDGYQALIDNEMKKGNVRKVNAKFSATPKVPMSLNKEGVIGGFLGLAQNNGYAIASGEFDGKTQKVSTQDYPLISIVSHKVGAFFGSLRQSVESLFGK